MKLWNLSADGMTTGSVSYVERRSAVGQRSHHGGSQQQAIIRRTLMFTVLLALIQKAYDIDYIDRKCAQRKQVSLQSCNIFMISVLLSFL